MPATVGYRFAVLDLAEGWIELEPGPAWKLAHAERVEMLRLSQFPVAAGVTMDLITLRVLAHERWRIQDVGRMSVPARLTDPLRRARGRMGGRVHYHQVFLAEDLWSERGVFCVASSLRVEIGKEASYKRGWTVSDGTHVLEASFAADTEERFRRSVEDCDRMMRSVRFEGAS